MDPHENKEKLFIFAQHKFFSKRVEYGNCLALVFFLGNPLQEQQVHQHCHGRP
jgi:hypothetical protein